MNTRRKKYIENHRRGVRTQKRGREGMHKKNIEKDERRGKRRRSIKSSGFF